MRGTGQLRQGWRHRGAAKCRPAGSAALADDVAEWSGRTALREREVASGFVDTFIHEVLTWKRDLERSPAIGRRMCLLVHARISHLTGLTWYSGIYLCKYMPAKELWTGFGLDQFSLERTADRILDVSARLIRHSARSPSWTR